MRSLARSAWIVVVLGMGCTSGTKGSVDGGQEATRPEGSVGGASSGERDARAVGSTDHDAAGAHSPTKSGSVIVVSRPTNDPSVFTNLVSAGFFDGPGNVAPKGCHRDTMGPCWALACTLTDGGAETPAPGVAQSAGAITIGGTTPGFTLTYDATLHAYAPTPAVPTNTAVFSGGDTVSFAATGSAAPAFRASIVAPTPLVVTAPDVSRGSLSIDASRDLVFTWTGSSTGELSFNVLTRTSASGAVVASTLVSCHFPGAGQTGTIPSVMLRRLGKTDDATTASLSTDLSSAREVVVGDYDVHLAVGSAATTADGKTTYSAAQVTIL